MDSAQKQIWFWNRHTSKEEVEEVYGDRLVRWLYQTRPGQILTDHILSKAYLSRVYGAYQSSKLSGSQVAPFIQKFKIPMEEYQKGPFKTFNDFFIRKFKPGMRPFVQLPGEFPAFSEARYFAYEKIHSGQIFPVKEGGLSAVGLLGSEEKAAPFLGGPLLLARLCPTDYHRFHFPDNGRVLESYPLHGLLHSVNPLALKYKEDIFITNERHVSILETENFGKLAYIEVGALCVGKIVQTYNGGKQIRRQPNAKDSKGAVRATIGDPAGAVNFVESSASAQPVSDSFKRGDEKGYFLFGGSTVIVLGQPGKWTPDSDLLAQTARGRETLVRLGERIARATGS